MQLPALQMTIEDNDAIEVALVASSINNYLNTLNSKSDVSQAIKDMQHIFQCHPVAADDIELNQRIINTLADRFKFSDEFNTTAGFLNRSSAIKGLIALRLATKGSHLWLAHYLTSNGLSTTASIISNWERCWNTRIDKSLVLNYAHTMQSTAYADQFKNDLQRYWDFIFINFELSQKSPDEIKLLAKMGANINECKYIIDPLHEQHPYTPLMLSAGANNQRLTEALIEAGADLNRQNPHGSTALMLTAAVNRRNPTIKILLDHGADMSLQNRSGQTVFDVAQCELYPELKKLLYEYAIEKGSANIVKKLQNRALGK